MHAFWLWSVNVAFAGHTKLQFGLWYVIVAFPGHTSQHVIYAFWSVVCCL